MKNIGVETKYVAMFFVGLLLTSCSDEPVLSLPEDRHTNEGAIASTADIDAQLEEQSLVGVWGAKVFETETELLIREQAPSAAT